MKFLIRSDVNSFEMFFFLICLLCFIYTDNETNAQADSSPSLHEVIYVNGHVL